jgi:hypothetical protein
MAANQELVHYIQESLKDGTSEEQIRKDLLGHGWDTKDVNSAFAAASGKPQAEAVAVAVSTSSKYKLRDAFKDTYAAIKNNLKAYLIIVGVAVIAAILSSLAFGALAAGFLAKAYSFNALILVGIVLFVAVLAVQSVISGAMMLAVNDGADGKVGDAKTSLKTAWSLVKRLFLTNLLVAAVIAIPLFIIFVIVGLQTALGNGGQVVSGPNTDGNILAFLLFIAAAVWAIIATLRYFLATYVAVFEPEVPVTKTLSRSQELVKDGGKIFMLKLIGVTFLAIIILSIIFGGGQSQSTTNSLGGNSENPFVNFLTTLVSLFMSATIVLLYRNRRAVKK